MVTAKNPSPLTKDSELSNALSACKSAFYSVGLFSLGINLLLLLPSIYMLQVYDRVLPSSSESTLVMLTLIALFFFVIMGALEWSRAQMMNVVSLRVDALLSGRIYDAMFIQTLASGGRSATAQPLNDLHQLRQFMTGPGLFAFFDAPWLPIYIFVLFLFHPAFGSVAIGSGIILLLIAFWNEKATHSDHEKASKEASAAQQITQANLRNAEVIEAMGMLPQLKQRWKSRQSQHLSFQSRATAKGGLITALSKLFRLSIQSLILGLGAYLAIHREISPGLVVAGSILLGRALAPLDQIIAHWRGLLHALQAYQHLDKLLTSIPAKSETMPLPAVAGEIRVENCVVTPPGAESPVLKGISFVLEPGMHLAIVGPSAAGKSTLARALLGLYIPDSGAVRLDGAELNQWDRPELGKYLGYLPQDVELLEGSISENIARFDEIDPEQVVFAAQKAGIHEMILRLPAGYDTRIEGQGNVLSAGQRQRLGLARALYNNPQFILLDEPNSNLDHEGDAALQNTLVTLKKSNKTVIVITHRGNILSLMDKILLIAHGEIVHYGARDQVLNAIQQSAQKPATPAEAVSLKASFTM
ncbi:MAG: type I secretion system permease/ATPase [Methylomicrobium sp.]|nr:type I secretion system permease/ATPase [Methylomicrobium sp.]